MLDLVERDVLQPGGISYLRLDGDVEASARFGIAQVCCMPHACLLSQDSCVCLCVSGGECIQRSSMSRERMRKPSWHDAW